MDVFRAIALNILESHDIVRNYLSFDSETDDIRNLSIYVICEKLRVGYKERDDTHEDSCDVCQ